MDHTIHGILQARILEWVAFPFSRRSSQSRDWTQISHIMVIDKMDRKHRKPPGFRIAISPVRNKIKPLDVIDKIRFRPLDHFAAGRSLLFTDWTLWKKRKDQDTKSNIPVSKLILFIHCDVHTHTHTHTHTTASRLKVPRLKLGREQVLKWQEETNLYFIWQKPIVSCFSSLIEYLQRSTRVLSRDITWMYTLWWFL